MNYKTFKKVWLDLMEVKSFYDKVFLQEDINDAYTMYKEDQMGFKTPKKWIEFFYVDFTEEKHPFYLKPKTRTAKRHYA